MYASRVISNAKKEKVINRMTTTMSKDKLIETNLFGIFFILKYIKPLPFRKM